MVKFGFKSDRGRVRDNNQDSYFVMPEEGIFLVADGGRIRRRIPARNNGGGSLQAGRQ